MVITLYSWTAFAACTPLSPLRVGSVAWCTSYLPPHWFVQYMHSILDILLINPSRPSSRHRGWRVWPNVGGPHTINPTLVATANNLGPYLIATDMWAVKSASILLLGLLWSSHSQLLGELILQLEETKQIILYLNNRKYNKLNVLKTKIISTYVCGLRPSINPLGFVLLLGVGLPE